MYIYTIQNSLNVNLNWFLQSDDKQLFEIKSRLNWKNQGSNWLAKNNRLFGERGGGEWGKRRYKLYLVKIYWVEVFSKIFIKFDGCNYYILTITLVFLFTKEKETGNNEVF